MSDRSGLREKVTRGGLVMAARWFLGTGLGLVGTVALTRLLGPREFGFYAVVLGVFLFVQALAPLGTNVFLVRHQEALTPRAVNASFNLALLSGVVLAVILACCAPLLARLIGDPALSGPAIIGLCAVAPAAAASVPLALLEREIEFQRVAAVELSNQLLFFAVAVPASWVLHTAYAPAIALLVQQLAALGSFSLAARYRPRLVIDRQEMVTAAKFGVSLTLSQWIWQMRQLANPVLVGHFLGPAAVGQVALAIRLTESLGFVRSVTWRLSIAALSRVQADRDAMRRAVSEGILLQILGFSLVACSFAAVSSVVVPQVFGAAWLPVVAVLPLICIGYVVNAGSNLLSSALYVTGDNWAVLRFHLVHVALFGAGLVALVPRFGIVGYGYAELVAVASYAVLYVGFARRIGPVSTTVPVAWLIAASSILMAGAWTEPAWLLGAVPAAVWAPARRAARATVKPLIAEAYRMTAGRLAGRRLATRWSARDRETRRPWQLIAADNLVPWRAFWIVCATVPVIGGMITPRFFLGDSASSLLPRGLAGPVAVSTVAALGALVVWSVARGNRPHPALLGAGATAWAATAAHVIPQIGVSQLGYMGLPLAISAIAVLPSIDWIDQRALIERVALFYAYGSLVAVLLIPDWALQSSYREGFLPGAWRLHGIAPHANVLAPIVSLYVLSRLDARRGPPGWGGYSWLNMSVVTLVILGAQSKTTIVAVVVLSVVMTARGAQRPFRGVMAIGLAGALLLGAATNVQSRGSAEAAASTFESRELVWAATYATWREHPVIGYGPGLWGADMRRAYRPLVGFDAPHAHNQVLQTLGESGVVGFAGLLVLLAFLAAGSARAWLAGSAFGALVLAMELVRMLSEAPFRSSLSDGSLLVVAAAIVGCLAGSRFPVIATTGR